MAPDLGNTPTPDLAGAADARTLPTPDASPSGDTSGASPITGPINRYLSVSPTSVDFGFVPPGTTAPPQTLTVAAKEDIADLQVYPPYPPGGVTLASTCGQAMAAGTSCTVVVTFDPSATGTWHGTVDLIADHDPLSVLLSAQVQNPGQLVISPSNLQEFNASPGNTSGATFRIFNSADTAMGPLSIAISGSGKSAFTATATGCDAISKGAACSIMVVYRSSSSPGSVQNASLEVATSTPTAQSVSVPLGGYVTSPS
jgi:hypothetical protein